MNSPSADPQHGTDEVGDSPPAVESADGESAVSEEVESGAERRGQTQSHPDSHEEAASTEVESRDFKGRLRQKDRRLTAKRRKAYRKLIDEVEDADGLAACGVEHGTPVQASRLGGSWWSVEEKERFFSALARYGRGDVRNIARVLTSKSVPEIQLYLLAFEAEPSGGMATEESSKYVSRADAPAAHEVGKKLETVVDSAADMVAIEEAANGAQAESKRYGDAWLIDAEGAATVDTLLERRPSSDREDRPKNIDQPPTVLLTQATRFFDTVMLLQLSRSVFMNGPPDGCWNYRTADLLQPAKGSSSCENDDENENDESENVFEPAIYQSAISELYSIARGVTEKLVHATLLQATSRVRAKDYDTPVPDVTTSDVRVATEILRLAVDGKQYWAELPRRVGLEVYSESNKYRAGRTGTKNGVKLTYDEVEAELGLDPPRSNRPDAAPPDRLERPVTGEDEDFDTEAEDEDVSSDGIIEVHLERERRKRRRGLSPNSFQRAEERYMQALDREADRAEDARLQQLLGLESLDVDVGGGDEVPERPKLKKQFRSELRSNWREHDEPSAAWEVERVWRVALEENDSETGGEAAFEDVDSDGSQSYAEMEVDT